MATKKVKSLGQQIDALYDVDQEIHRIHKELTEVKQKRAKLETRLLKNFDKKKVDGCRTSKAVSSIKKTDFPSIGDRKKFFKYVAKAKAFDLLQSRIASRAYFDRLEEGEEVPGVKVFTRISVSIRKRGNK